MSEEGAAEIVKGDTLKKSQRYSEAASCYEKAFRMNPGEPEPLIKKIGALLLAGDSEDAMDDAFDAGNRLVEHFPDSAAAYEARGRLLAHCNQHDDAVVDFAAALELDPNSIEAYKGRGFSLIALGRHKEAAKMYGRAVRLRPDDSSAVFYLCYELEELGRYHDALAALKAYLPFDEMHNYEVYRHMGRVLGLLGDARGSFANYVRSVSLNRPRSGDNPRVLRRYRGIKALRRRIEMLDPSDPSSFYKAGMELLDAKWDSTALDMIGTGTRFLPLPQAYGIIGEVRMRYLQYTEAIGAYKRALELPQEIPMGVLTELYANLLKCLFGCGRFREVREYGKKAVSLNITGQNVEAYYRAALEMGPESTDHDQVADGWTVKIDI